MQSFRLPDHLSKQIATSHGEPISLRDESTGKTYVMVEQDTYAHLQGLSREANKRAHDRLRELVQEGMDSPDVESEEAERRIRRLLNKLSAAEL